MAAFQLTLTSADTNYNLLTLIRAIDEDFVDNARHLSIQADPSNGSAVLIGDTELSATRYGISLGNGEGKVYGDGVTPVQGLRTTLARSTGAAQKINVEVRR